MPRPIHTPPRACLVGAGPGDPGLISVRGLERLRRADVVVFDALADPALLEEAPPGALRIDAGKRGGTHTLTQDQTNQLMADHALAGRFVVRLKGGDPYLFGRGAEEVAFLAARGVECEVVPGITSGLAAPALAGIPVTHRKIASTVTLVTGHEEPGKDASAIDYRALAQLILAGGTVCFYMGVGRLASIVAALHEGSLPLGTPAAVVQWGGTPRQRSVRATLAELAQRVERAGVGSPAIIVVGAVAAIDEPGLDFFTDIKRRPLLGQRVLVTRTRQQASDLRVLLAELGAEVLEAPTIELVPPADWTEVDEALWRVREFDWLVLTSVNGVDAVAQRLEALKLDARQFAGVRIAAIGAATADALHSRLRLSADLVPTQFVAESLAAELIARHGVDGRKFLLLRADIARPALPTLLMRAGAVVTELTVYQTKIVDALPPRVLTALREKSVHWVTFTSSSTATNLVELLGAERELLRHCKLASIGPITSDTLKKLGFPPTLEAAVSTIPGLVEAITSPAV